MKRFDSDTFLHTLRIADIADDAEAAIYVLSQKPYNLLWYTYMRTAMSWKVSQSIPKNWLNTWYQLLGCCIGAKKKHSAHVYISSYFFIWMPESKRSIFSYYTLVQRY